MGRDDERGGVTAQERRGLLHRHRRSHGVERHLHGERTERVAGHEGQRETRAPDGLDVARQRQHGLRLAAPPAAAARGGETPTRRTRAWRRWRPPGRPRPSARRAAWPGDRARGRPASPRAASSAPAGGPDCAARCRRATRRRRSSTPGSARSGARRRRPTVLTTVRAIPAMANRLQGAKFQRKSPSGLTSCWPACARTMCPNELVEEHVPRETGADLQGGEQEPAQRDQQEQPDPPWPVSRRAARRRPVARSHGTARSPRAASTTPRGPLVSVATAAASQNERPTAPARPGAKRGERRDGDRQREEPVPPGGGHLRCRDRRRACTPVRRESRRGARTAGRRRPRRARRAARWPPPSAGRGRTRVTRPDRPACERREPGQHRRFVRVAEQVVGAEPVAVLEHVEAQAPSRNSLSSRFGAPVRRIANTATPTPARTASSRQTPRSAPCARAAPSPPWMPDTQAIRRG